MCIKTFYFLNGFNNSARHRGAPSIQKKCRTLQSKSKQQTYDQRCRNRTGAFTAQRGMAEEEAEITSLSEERR